MNKEFYQGNREKLYAQMKENALLVLFSGTEVRKTNDEFYPFYTNRNFLYLTGLDQKELALIARKDGAGRVTEKVYILPPDWLVERWSGERIKAAEAAERSGIADVGYTDSFEAELHRLATSGNYQYLYLDLFRVSPTDRDEPAHRLLKRVASDYPYLQIENANALIRRMRTIKQPCELEAMRKPACTSTSTRPCSTTHSGSTARRAPLSPRSFRRAKTISASITTPTRARPTTATWS